jgi:hypothetical protein
MFYAHPLNGLQLSLDGSPILYFCQSKQSQSVLQSAGIWLQTGWPAILAWILLLAASMALDRISKPYRVPMRALFVAPYAAWLATMGWLEISTKLKRPRALAFGGFQACLLIQQSIITISHYNAARACNKRSDQLVASTVAAAIAACPDQGPEVNQLMTQVSVGRNNPIELAGILLLAHHSSPGTMVVARGSAPGQKRWVSQVSIRLPKGDEIRFGSQFQTMKAWPQQASIKIEDQTVLIKLSNKK